MAKKSTLVTVRDNMKRVETTMTPMAYENLKEEKYHRQGKPVQRYTIVKGAAKDATPKGE